MAVSSKVAASLVLVLTLGAVLAGMALRGGEPTPEIISLFRQKLSGAGVDGVVVIGSKSFAVRGDAVEYLGTGTMNAREELAALKVAYVRAWTERSGILSLEGSDTELMNDALARLRESATALASLQSDPVAARHIADGIYPTDYLAALVSLEERRVAFVASGKDADLDLYMRAAEAALEKGEKAVRNFSSLYDGYTQGRFENIAILGGTLSKERTLEQLARITQRLEEETERYASMRGCLKGSLSLCPALRVSAPASIDSGKIPRDESRMRRILSLVDEAYGSRASLRQILALSDASCLEGTGADYLLRRSDAASEFATYFYVGDLILQPLEREHGDTLDWFSRAGVSHLLYNPVTFYKCPSAAADIARAKIVLNIADALALSDPRADGAVIYEDDVLSALRAALRDAPKEEAQRLGSLLRAYERTSGGFEDVLYDMARGLEILIHFHGTGAPTDLSAAALFATHSGYFGLFLGHTDGRLPSSPIDPAGAEAFWKTFESYSAIAGSVADADIVYDISFYFGTHK